MKQSDDESILAWASNESVEHGLLADSPRAFKDSGKITYASNNRRHADQDTRIDPSPSLMSNKGLPLTLPVCENGSGNAIAVLGCSMPGRDGVVGLQLRHLAGDRWVRTACHVMMSMRRSGELRRLCVSQTPGTNAGTPLGLGVIRCSIECDGYDYRAVKAMPRGNNLTIEGDQASSWSCVMPYAIAGDADADEASLAAQELLAAVWLEGPRRTIAILLLLSLVRTTDHTMSESSLYFDVHERFACSALESLEQYQTIYRPALMLPNTCKHAGPLSVSTTWGVSRATTPGVSHLHVKVKISDLLHDGERTWRHRGLQLASRLGMTSN